MEVLTFIATIIDIVTLIVIVVKLIRIKKYFLLVMKGS